MCDSVVSEDFFMLLYCPNKYKTQRMCDETVDDCLAALKFIPDWLATSKILKNFDKALLANDDILFFNEDFIKATFSIYQKHILVVDPDKINFSNDNNFDEDDPDTIIYVRLLACRSKLEKQKALKKR